MPFLESHSSVVLESVAIRSTLHLQRSFDAPRALLWRAWSRPECLAAWMGPAEWPAFSVISDFRVGGVWRIGLRSPETGEELWQGGTYTEIVEPRRLSFTFKWDEGHEDGPPVETLVTVEFTEAEDGHTIMDFTQAGLKSEASLTGHRYGWSSTADRLEAWLAANPD